MYSRRLIRLNILRGLVSIFNHPSLPKNKKNLTPPHPQLNPTFPLLPAAYGIETFTDFFDLRSLLPREDDDDDDNDNEIAANGDVQDTGTAALAERDAAALIEHTPGGGLAAPFAALRRVAPRSARFLRRFRRLNEALAQVIEDYNLVSFMPVSAASDDTTSVSALLAKADHAIGYVRTAGR